MRRGRYVGRVEDLEQERRAHEAAVRASPEDLDVLADAAEFYVGVAEDEGDPEWGRRALSIAERGSKVARRGGEPDDVADFALLESAAASASGDPRDALARLERALQACPGHPALAVERGLLLFDLCRFEDARRQLGDALAAGPEEADPAAHHTLGLIAERTGDEREAAARFAAARAIAPDDFPRPVHLSHRAFEAAVEDALAELPEPVRSYLSNVAIAVEDFPPDDDLLSSDPPLPPTVLGMFRGAPLGDNASMDPWSHFPSSIVLYQRNLKRFATDRRDLVEQIRVTLLHEVGHFLGLDEDQLRERGLD